MNASRLEVPTFFALRSKGLGGRLKACQLSLSLLSKSFDIQVVGRLLQIGMAVNRKQRKN